MLDPLPGWVIIQVEEKRTMGSLELPESAQSSMQQGSIVVVNPIFNRDGMIHDYTEYLKPEVRVAFKKYFDNDIEVDGSKYKVVHIDNIMTVL